MGRIRATYIFARGQLGVGASLLVLGYLITEKHKQDPNSFAKYRCISTGLRL